MNYDLVARKIRDMGANALKDIAFMIIGVMLVVVIGANVYLSSRLFHKPMLTTTYQAVTLVNGDVLYGRIDHLGTDHPVLRDAFKIQMEGGAEGQAVRYSIVEKKLQLNGADHVIFPASAILSVEPVNPDSAIGKLVTSRKHR